MPKLVDFDDLQRIIADEEKIHPLRSDNIAEASAQLAAMRDARGIDTEGARAISILMARHFVSLLSLGPIELLMGACFLSGFDLGVSAAIEAETRRVSEATS